LLSDPKRRTQKARLVAICSPSASDDAEAARVCSWSPEGPKGKKTALYVCKDKGCVGRREEWVDELVVTTVCERLSKPDALGLPG